mmetsp:Transcript_31113/g.46974  ORF Transcript_31113/g.46974 Transcript_31113/m.46974 type:complete len:212 (-) Transcript_31113:75-710(-)
MPAVPNAHNHQPSLPTNSADSRQRQPRATLKGSASAYPSRGRAASLHSTSLHVEGLQGLQGLIQGVHSGEVGGLLRLHGRDHDAVQHHQELLVLLGGEIRLLHFLGHEVVTDGVHDLASMLLLGLDPAHHLVDVLQAAGLVEVSGLHHGLSDGCSILDHALQAKVVGEDAARDLAMEADCRRSGRTDKQACTRCGHGGQSSERAGGEHLRN